MNISKMIIESIEQKEYDDYLSGDCCLCGNKKSFKYENRNKILSTSFTDFNVMKNRDSQFICGYCEKLLDDRYMESPKGKRCGIRLYSFFIENKKFKIIQKSEKEKYLFDYQFNLPYILCLSDSGQKHISWKSKEGQGNRVITINTENGLLIFDRDKYITVYTIIKKLFENGISKEELVCCNLIPKKIQKIIDNNISSFQEIIFIKRFKNDNCYNFIINCLYKIKENKDD